MVEMGIIYEIKHFITLTLLIQTCWMKLMYRNSKTDYMWWVLHWWVLRDSQIAFRFKGGLENGLSHCTAQ